MAMQQMLGPISGSSDYQIDRSLRFNSADSAYLNRTPSSAGNRRTFTYSVWVKRNNLGTRTALFGVGTAQNDSSYFAIEIESAGDLRVSGWNTLYAKTNDLFRDPAAWYHLVVAVDTTQSAASDQIKIYKNGTLVTKATENAITQNTELPINSTSAHNIGYQPQANQYGDKMFANIEFIDGQALAVSSFGEFDDDNNWMPKKYSGTYGTNGFHLDFSDNSSNSALGDDSSGNNNDWTVNNLVAASKVWSNLTTPSNTSTQFPYSRGFDGVITGDGGTAGFAGWLNSAGNITITFPSGVSVSNTINIYSGDGLNGSTTASVTVSGSTTTSAAASGYITNKSFSGISGNLESITLTNAGGGVRFYGIQIDGTTLVDVPGSDVDSLIDTPTNYEANSGNNGGNYATLNPLNKHTSNNSLTNGNLEFTSSGNDGTLTESTIAMSSGKYYFEVVYSGGQGTGQLAGIRKPGARNYDDSYIYVGTGNKYTNGGSSASYGASLVNGDVIGTAFDADNGTLTFYKNGVSQGQAFSGISGSYSFLVGSFGSTPTGAANFGQRPFAYTPPTNHKSLCTQNLTDPPIADGSTAMDATLYNGNGGTAQTISGINHSPDFVWYKHRSAASSHGLFDIVRGANNYMNSNGTGAEQTVSGVTAFNSNGFSLGTDTGANGSGTWVAWTWGGGSYPTNSSYNQTAKWSDDASGTLRSVAGNTHLGAFSGLENYNNTKEWTQIDGDNTWTFAPSGGISSVQGLKVIVYPRHGTLTINVNGSQVTTNTGNSLNTVDLSSAFSTPGTLNNITITSSGSGSYWGIASVQVNTGSGYKILADPGVDTNGSIASITRANQSAGFSIISYTGTGANASIGHGLNAAPEFFFGRNRDDTSGSLDWIVYHKSVGNTGRLKLNTTGGTSTSSVFFQNTSPSSSVITIGTSNDINKSGDDYILYCFTPVAGYSAFGSYTGNGSSDGTFVYTGFRVAWLMTKRTDTAENWEVRDSTRNPHNRTNLTLFPHSSGAEDTGSVDFDLLSNGFKLRNTNGSTNASGGTYIYMAFAENPFKTARAR